MKNTPTRTRY